MRFSALGVVFILSAVSFAAAAQPESGDSYIGGQYASVGYDEDGFPEVEPSALVLRGGQFINDNFAIEGRFGFGLSDDSAATNINGYDVDVAIDIKRIFGVYGKGYLPVNDVFGVYGVFGFTDAKLEATASNGSVSETVSQSDSGFSYGIGFDVFVKDSLSVNGEYMSYLDESGYTADALSFGGSLHFEPGSF